MKNLTQPIRPGDIKVEFNPYNLIDEAIAIFEYPILYKGIEHNVSHAEIIIGVHNDETIDVMSADVDGFNLNTEPVFDAPFVEIFTCDELSALQRMEIVRWSIAHRGVGYNFLGLASFLAKFSLNEPKHLYCSQGVFLAYQFNADEFFTNPQCRGVTLLNNTNTVAPFMIPTSTKLRSIGGTI